MEERLQVDIDGRQFYVPVVTCPSDPSKTTIGPLPPEVAERYEVRYFLTPFLMRTSFEDRIRAIAAKANADEPPLL